jgi:hypothetical protein
LKPETVSYGAIVSEALDRMRDLTAASPAYEVDRSLGQWTVRRALKTSEKGFPSHIVAVLTGASQS